MDNPTKKIIDEIYEVVKREDFPTAYPKLQKICGDFAIKYSKELLIDALIQFSIIMGKRLYHCEEKLKDKGGLRYGV